MAHDGTRYRDEDDVHAREEAGDQLLVYIIGAPHSGSTLLSLLLNGSPDIQAMGEIHRLRYFARTARPCSCGCVVTSCSFWSAVQDEVNSRLGVPPNTPSLTMHELMLEPSRLNPVAARLQELLLILGMRRTYNRLAPAIAPYHAKAIAHSLVIYDVVRSVSGRRAVLDSTKDSRRLAALYLASPTEVRVINLLRDGRAVAASAIRRNGTDMRTAARKWRAMQMRAAWARRPVPKAQVIDVRYETLCADPARVLSEVCDFLGVRPGDDMLRLDKPGSHMISGNPMRLRHGETTVTLDDRWRTQLTPDELGMFDKIAGRTNRGLGYDA